MKVYMTKVFQNGGSKAIRIPAPLRPDADELFVWADDLGRIVVSENMPKSNPTQFLQWATAQPRVSAEAELFLKRDQPLDDFSNPLEKTTDAPR